MGFEARVREREGGVWGLMRVKNRGLTWREFFRLRRVDARTLRFTADAIAIAKLPHDLLRSKSVRPASQLKMAALDSGSEDGPRRSKRQRSEVQRLELEPLPPSHHHRTARKHAERRAAWKAAAEAAAAVAHQRLALLRKYELEASAGMQKDCQLARCRSNHAQAGSCSPFRGKCANPCWADAAVWVAKGP